MATDYLTAFSQHQPSIYDAQQTMHVLEHSKHSYSRPDYFGEMQQDCILPEHRRAIIEWFGSITTRKNLSKNIIVRATMLFDHFMSLLPSLQRHPLLQTPQINFYTFAGAIAYDVGAKVETQHGIAKSIVLSFKVRPAQFLEAELLLLETLEYNVNFATPLQVLEALAPSLEDAQLINSRPESPAAFVQEDRKLAFLLARAADLVHTLAHAESFIGLSPLETALIALHAAALIRRERIAHVLRRICRENDVSFDLVQQGARHLQELALKEEIDEQV